MAGGRESPHPIPPPQAGEGESVPCGSRFAVHAGPVGSFGFFHGDCLAQRKPRFIVVLFASSELNSATRISTA